MHPSHFGAPSLAKSGPQQQSWKRRKNFPPSRESNIPRLGESIKLITNAYSIKRTSRALPIYQYQLVVSLSSGSRQVSDKALSRSYVSRSIRKLITEKIIPDLIDPQHNIHSVVVNHNLSTIYSLTRFDLQCGDSKAPSSGEKIDDGFRFARIQVESELLYTISIDLFIKYIGPMDGTIDFGLLSTVLNHNLMLSMVKFGSSYFQLRASGEVRPQDDLDGLDLLSRHTMGFSVSGLKKCSRSPDPLVVISCNHSYMTQPRRLIDLLGSFIIGHPISGLDVSYHRARPYEPIFRRMPEIAAINGHEQWWLAFQSILRDYKFRANGPEGVVNLRFSLSDAPASTLFMSDGPSNAQITVHEYFLRHGIPLAYPNLPCIPSRSARIPYYPFELCTLIAGQKVPIFRLSQAACEHMIALNKVRPVVAKNSSSRIRDQIAALNEVYFRSFGVELSRNSVEATGSMLQRPTLQFQDQEFEPEREFWESGVFYQAMNLIGNWCVINTAPIDHRRQDTFFAEFSHYCTRHGFRIDRPKFISRTKQQILERPDTAINDLIQECQQLTNGNLKLVMFVIDSKSTQLNRLVHLSFEGEKSLTSTCLRVESIMNVSKQRSIFRTLVHKLNARLGGTNVTYDFRQIEKLDLKSEDLLIVGLDVTHPDNELSGVSIVGCAYTFGRDLFRHRSLVWPQQARVEIIGRIDHLMRRLIGEYLEANQGLLPKHVVIYRDGVSHEDFEKVQQHEVSKAQSVLSEVAEQKSLPRPNLTYIIAQKRHNMRFFRPIDGSNQFCNPPSGTIIDKDVVSENKRAFYLYSSTNPQSTSRPLHYYVLLIGMDLESLQKLTYSLCFNFGKCSATLSMPSSLKYAHNAAYDARNRVIASKEFIETHFYPSKFFC